MHTLRDFTPIEREDKANESLKGVRTYWFGAHHWRGVPDMTSIISEDNQNNTSDWIDYAWVPKRQLNEFFSKDYHDVFINITKTR